MNLKIQKKLSDVPQSIFPVMTGLAIEHNAVNLAQGFPGFDADEELIQLVNKYMWLVKTNMLQCLEYLF